ncbi:MAG: hypothetical protein UT48_C0010G0041 [Parcubacteria group bacterium GW2011_GWE2_39_37]|uniref:Uncharacterized protein n=1 Tax=Candidatus Falkowbacteria bacterium GW2011_GWF2_39_8 TaxID=1618642 RepID=A0A0G0PZM3_9BACT|nr:MAG: hypothetical protein UT48_C0010G0041 [Parcubacteria group bacterium GW2011_GWE2_39_37]KKR33358.1 MAG: hypothetical protein UT64_C0010G0032 [Candidatus Falkowbacteria bacterium GW2011_GWF2_39_8]
MNQKTIVAIILIVVVILIGSTVYFAISKNETIPTPRKIEQVSPTPIPTTSTTTELIPPPAANQQPEITANYSMTSCKTDNQAYFKIKELGIKVLVDKNIVNDLTYEYSGKTNFELGSARLSSKSLTAKDNDCSAKEAPLGVILKVNGEPTDSANKDYYQSRQSMIKQFDGYFIHRSGPQAPCSSVEETIDYAGQLYYKILLLDNLQCVAEI